MISLNKRWPLLACFASIMLLSMAAGFGGDCNTSSSLGLHITAHEAAEPRLEIMADSVAAGFLSLDKNAYDPGEEMKVSFNAPQGYANNAWIGIIPSSAAHGSEEENDKHDLAYQFLNGQTSGILTFNAPQELGSYDLRMHNSDDNGEETASMTFSVRIGNGSIWLDRNVYKPAEQIEVHFEASEGFPSDAWIGIVPSNIPHGSEAENDKFDLSFQFLKKNTSGTLIFQAPQDPGSYDLRMHNTDTDGKEVASVSFVVQAAKDSSSDGKDVTEPGDSKGIVRGYLEVDVDCSDDPISMLTGDCYEGLPDIPVELTFTYIPPAYSDDTPTTIREMTDEKGMFEFKDVPAGSKFMVKTRVKTMDKELEGAMPDPAGNVTLTFDFHCKGQLIGNVYYPCGYEGVQCSPECELYPI
jgi:hypothetical protein